MAFDNERSSIWGLTAGAAVTGGAGYGFIKNRNAFSEALNMGSGPGYNFNMNLPSFRTSTSGIAESSVLDATYEAMASSFEARTGLSGAITDIRNAAYESILSGRLTSHEEAIEALKIVGEQGSGTDAYKAAMGAISRHGGKTSIFESRLAEFSASTNRSYDVSPGGFGTKFQGKTTFSNLPTDARKRAVAIQRNIGQVAKGKFKVKWDYQLRKDLIGGKELSTPMLIGKIGGQNIGNIPLVDEGIGYSGKDLSARYNVRGGYMAGGTQLSYSELYERNIGDAISASATHAELKRNLLDSHQNLIEQMNVRDSSHRAAAVWTSPFVTSGGAAKARLTALEAVPYGDIKPEITSSLIGDGLYPWTSAGAAGKGVLTTENLADTLYGPMGGMMSAEEIPTQFVRGEWGVTTEAKGRARGFGGTFGQNYSRLSRKNATEGYKELIYGGGSAFSGEAYSAPQLMTFYARPDNGKFGLGYADSQLNRMLSAEEGVISSSVADMMEYERLVPKKIALDPGMRSNQDLLFQLHGKQKGIPINLEGVLPSGFMGVEKGTGANIAGEIVGAELTGENSATVFLRERKQLSEEEMWKFFSEENKFTAAAANEARMGSVLSAAGAESTIAGQRVEAVFSGKLVQKRKAALITQQMEAASMFLSNKIDTTDLIATPEITAFLNDPSAALNVKGLMQSNAATADIQIQKNLMGLTKGWGFSNKELGLTFGLAPEAALESGVLTARQRMAVRQSPGVIGLGKGFLGDIMSEGGAGSWGSFEQTGFRALAMKGELGQRYAVEMSKRISGSGELAAADTMMSTILGQENIAKRTMRDKGALSNLADLDSNTLLQSEGRYVNLGRKVKELGGSDVLYIPGTDEAGSMMRDMVVDGKRVRTPVTQKILSLQSALSRGSEDGIGFAAKALREVTIQASEAQAAARGKIIGSQMLAGQRKNFIEDPDVFRVSKGTGEDMFGDLISRAEDAGEANYLKGQRDLFREGKVMTGGMWRHPTTGPESFQWAKFKMDASVANGMVQAPTQFGKIQFQGGKEVAADVSAMVGFKGDFDNDKFVLSVIADRRTADAARRAVDNEARQSYSAYLFNHYAMKDAMEGKASKAAILEMTANEAMQQGHRKLATAKTTTGGVNIALQKLKIGLQATNSNEYAPLSELFFNLEEAAISGKHGVLSSDLYQAIGQSTKKGGEEGITQMESVIRRLMGEKRTVSGQVVDAFGNARKHSLDINPRKWAEKAIGAHDAVSQEVNVTMRAVAAARGKNLGDISLNQAVEMYHARRTGSVDFAQSMMQAGANNTDNFTIKGTRLLRKGQVKARGMLSAMSRAKKPLLAGLGIAAGVMLMAPSTSGVLRNPESASGGGGMMSDDYGAPSGHGMSPSQPRMNASPRTYDIGSGSKTSHANIRMSVNDLDSSSKGFMRSARQLSSGGQVNIRTRDDRSVLDPRMLANKIHERL